MSLHLIESTHVRHASSRKRGGATASILIHSALVVGSFAAASAAPLTGAAVETTKTLVYVPPPRIQTRTSTQAPLRASSAHNTGTHARIMPRMPDIAQINIEIPTVSVELTMDAAVRDFSTRSDAESRSGTGTDTNGASSDAFGTGSPLTNLQVDQQVTALSGYRTPRYPEAMRSLGVEATITAQFVVDTLGRIEANSLELRDAQHAPFFPAVREALANARFRPAKANGRRVRQLVMQSFVFSLGRD